MFFFLRIKKRKKKLPLQDPSPKFHEKSPIHVPLEGPKVVPGTQVCVGPHQPQPEDAVQLEHSVALQPI